MMVRNVIKLDSENCFGCSACAAICPTKALVMQEDSAGFLLPHFNSSLCIGCGACKRTCPAISELDLDESLLIRWGYATDRNTRSNSSSGGLFTLLAEKTLNVDGGIVVGAAFDSKSKTVCHKAVRTKKDLDKLRSSKYVQSFVSPELYLDIRNALKAGKPVLFSGTGCQVAGLKRYLGKLTESDLLLLVDVVCHGVPSPKLFQSWLDYIGENCGSDVVDVCFRDKRTGWESYSVSYRLADARSLSHLSSEDWYMRAFLNELSIRPSCFSCRFKLSCGSDITLGDFWGIKRHHREVQADLGVSCVIVHTEKGVNAISNITSFMHSDASSFENVVSGNPSIVRSTAVPKDYERFQRFIANLTPIEEIKRRFPLKRPFIKKLLSHAVAYVRWLELRLMGVWSNDASSF